MSNITDNVRVFNPLTRTQNTVDDIRPQYFGKLEMRPSMQGESNPNFAGVRYGAYDNEGDTGIGTGMTNYMIPTSCELINNSGQGENAGLGYDHSAPIECIQHGMILFGKKTPVKDHGSDSKRARSAQTRGTPKQHRFTVYQLNCLLYLAHLQKNKPAGSVDGKHGGNGVFTNARKFKKEFFMSGVVLLADTSSVSALGQPGLSGGRGPATHQINQCVKGATTALNIWGNCATPTDHGAYLWLVLKWVTDKDRDSNQVPSLLDSTHMNQSAIKDDGTTGWDKLSSDPADYFLQLVPICTHDSRPPLLHTRSPIGDGALYYVGKVIQSNHNPSQRTPYRSMVEKYHRLVHPTFTTNESNVRLPAAGNAVRRTASYATYGDPDTDDGSGDHEQFGYIQVAVSCGMHHTM